MTTIIFCYLSVYSKILVLLYDNENLTITVKAISKLNTTEIKFMHGMAGYTWHFKPNEEILQEQKVTPFFGGTKWIDHMNCISRSRFSNLIQ